MTNKQSSKKNAKRDPREALEAKMRLVSSRIQKILLENEMAIHPFIENNPYNGALTPRVRLISTKNIENDTGTNQEQAEGTGEADTPTPTE